MTKRQVVKAVLDGQKPPYVPWSFSFTQEAHERLVRHYGTDRMEPFLHNHFLGLGNGIGFFEAWFAVPWAGAVIVPLNTRLAVPELDFQLRDAGVVLLLHDRGLFTGGWVASVFTESFHDR